MLNYELKGKYASFVFSGAWINSGIGIEQTFTFPSDYQLGDSIYLSLMDGGFLKRVEVQFYETSEGGLHAKAISASYSDDNGTLFHDAPLATSANSAGYGVSDFIIDGYFTGGFLSSAPKALNHPPATLSEEPATLSEEPATLSEEPATLSEEQDLTEVFRDVLTATQSSSGWGGDAAKAIDGDTNGVYNHGSTTHTHNGENEWWQVDLGQSALLTRIELYNRESASSRLNGATVEVLDAENNVIQSFSPIEQAGDASVHEFVLTNPALARFVRVSQHNEYLSLAEVKVYGFESVDESVANPDNNTTPESTLPLVAAGDSSSLASREEQGLTAVLHGKEITFTMGGAWINSGIGVEQTFTFPSDYQLGDSVYLSLEDGGYSKSVEVQFYETSEGGLHAKAISASYSDDNGASFHDAPLAGSAAAAGYGVSDIIIDGHTTGGFLSSAPKALNHPPANPDNNSTPESALPLIPVGDTADNNSTPESALPLIPVGDTAFVVNGEQQDLTAAFRDVLTATQSSVGWGGDAAKAIDGDTNGDYDHGSTTHTNDGESEWWQVDLGQTALLTGIELYNRDILGSRLNGVTVRVLDAEHNVIQSFPPIEQAGDASAHEFVLTTPALARFVRVSKHNQWLSQAEPISLAEVKVYGFESVSENVDWQYQVDGGDWQTGVGQSIDLLEGTYDYAVRQKNLLGQWEQAPSERPQRLEYYPLAIESIGLSWGDTLDTSFVVNGEEEDLTAAFRDLLTATQSPGVRGSTDGSKAVDGDINGLFSHGSTTLTGNGGNEWWQVDLGQSAVLTRIELYNRAGEKSHRLNGSTVEVLDAEHNVIQSFPIGQPGVGPSHDSSFHEFVLTTPALARFVRVSQYQEHISLAEVKVYGFESVPLVPTLIPEGDNDNGTVIVTTRNIEDGRLVNFKFDGHTYTGEVQDNIAEIVIPARLINWEYSSIEDFISVGGSILPTVNNVSEIDISSIQATFGSKGKDLPSTVVENTVQSSDNELTFWVRTTLEDTYFNVRAIRLKLENTEAGVLVKIIDSKVYRDIDLTYDLNSNEAVPALFNYPVVYDDSEYGIGIRALTVEAKTDEVGSGTLQSLEEKDYNYIVSVTNVQGNEEIIVGRGEFTIDKTIGIEQQQEDDQFLKLGTEDDTRYLGSGNDTVFSGQGDDELHGGEGNDLLSGDLGNDRLYGGRGSDLLYGGVGEDVLDGGSSADILTGGEGNDRLTGGTGEDRFIFGAMQNGHDTITDFELANQSHRGDKLDFSEFLYNNNSTDIRDLFTVENDGGNIMLYISTDAETPQESIQSRVTLEGISYLENHNTILDTLLDTGALIA